MRPVFLADEIRTWLEGRTRLQVELASIEDGAIQMGAVGSARSETWMSKIRATVTREVSGSGATTVVKGTAALLGSGDTAFKVSQPEGENQPASGELQVNYLSLADLYLFLDGTPPSKDLTPGTLAVAARFKVDGPEVTGLLRTSSAGVRASDLPAPLVERLRVRLSAAAPFIEARRRVHPRPGGVRPARDSLARWQRQLVEGDVRGPGVLRRGRRRGGGLAAAFAGEIRPTWLTTSALGSLRCWVRWRPSNRRCLSPQ